MLSLLRSYALHRILRERFGWHSSSYRRCDGRNVSQTTFVETRERKERSLELIIVFLPRLFLSPRFFLRLSSSCDVSEWIATPSDRRSSASAVRKKTRRLAFDATPKRRERRGTRCRRCILERRSSARRSFLLVPFVTFRLRARLSRRFSCAPARRLVSLRKR